MAQTSAPTVDHEKLEIRAVEQRQSNAAVSQKTAFPRWNQKGKEKNTVARACTWVVDHQISISLTLISALALTHALYPAARHHTEKFFSISYYNTSTGTYALGWDDIFFVFYWIIVFTGLRCIFLSHILSPTARWLGLKKPKARTRFAEQAWIIIYYTLSWCTGMYIMYNSDYWLDLRAMWKDWPIREMDGLSKWYYLVQFAFWLQQIVVVNIEERRKDHWQMFAHHLITCTLIFGSYGYHWSKVGTVILCLMDVVDIFLPLAKVFKYLHYRTACDVTFGIFMVSWFIARHVFYMWVVWSAYLHTPQEIAFGCYRGSVTNLTGPTPVPDDWYHVIEPFLNPVGSVCFNKNVQLTFISLLLALQVLLVIWLGLIVNVAYKVITGRGAEDTRSDDEDSGDIEEEEEEAAKTEVVPEPHTTNFPSDTKLLYEQEVLSTDTNFAVSSRPNSRTSTGSRSPMGRSSRRKGDGNASGVNLLAGSDRKELLGRIGCDKGTDL